MKNTKIPTVNVYYAPDITKGKNRISLRITYDRKHTYIRLPYDIAPDEMKNGVITNRFVRVQVDKAKNIAEQVVLELPPDLQRIKRKCVECLQLKPRKPKEKTQDLNDTLYLDGTDIVFRMDFFKIAEEYVRKHDRVATRNSINIIMLGKLRAYCEAKGIGFLGINDLKTAFVQEYKEWVESQTGKNSSTVMMSLRYLRAIINYAKSQYNDEEENITLVTIDPFKKVEIPKQRKSDFAERKTIPASVMRQIIEMQPTGDRHIDMARDFFVLSFAMCGANISDIEASKYDKDDRVCFDRQKTRDRVTDGSSYISIKVEPEYKAVFERYAHKNGITAFDFSRFRRKKSSLLQQVNYGLKKLREKMINDYAAENNVSVEVAERKLGVGDMSYYAARHTWSSIAVNDCGIDIITVDRCLCHSVASLVARSYIKQDFKFVDVANRRVLDYVMQ